ncbi:dihydrodipicolinate synthase family protein [Sphingobacterium hotanense]|uniref:dihydrodipicolinate synthase family protein n=1 Tax=Sphingobacterium hotanense TaxID=649196 RepID=UPI0021A7988B|nr:dihydrodipicolinate synthase family protein [Sphingobacterium hotanense]MCT1526041.1 dihydrodipicolinate synthase family protein [Sphingobacterium hotanense]
MKINKIKGLIAPVFTPMYGNGEVAYERIADYGEYIIEKDLAGVFIAGSSGEGMLLSNKERKLVMEEWAPFDSEEFKLIVHVGHTSYKEAQDLAIHAEDNNAYAVSAMAPVFLQSNNIESLVDYLGKIASAVPNLPFYYYHIPLRTGLDINVVKFLEYASQEIPNLAGIKFTHSNLIEMQQCVQYEGGKFDILQGADISLMSGLLMGVQGAIGTTYNFASDWYKELLRAVEINDLPSIKILQEKIIRLNSLLSKYGGGIVAGKAIIKELGMDCGICRSPLRNLTLDEINSLRADLKDLKLI